MGSWEHVTLRNVETEGIFDEFSGGIIQTLCRCFLRCYEIHLTLYPFTQMIK
jgi:hypothetical protein